MRNKLTMLAIAAAVTAGTSGAALAQYACPAGYAYYNGYCQPYAYAPTAPVLSYYYSPPAMTTAVASASPASIDVRVPSEAEIWFEGARTNQTGSERAFVSPPLDPGGRYTYEFRARWFENGRAVLQTRRVPVQAGEQIVVDFTS